MVTRRRKTESKQRRTERDLRLAAMQGDRAACRALLRYHGFGDLAKDIPPPNKPISGRARRMVGAITAGTGTETELGAWEWVNPTTGEIENLLHGEVDTRNKSKWK